MNQEEMNYYDFLGVSKDAPIEEIKKSYRKIMRQHHPDIASGPEHEEISRKASEVYKVLSDESSRKEYDKSLEEPEPEPISDPGFAPSWGEEEEWDILDEEVVEPEVNPFDDVEDSTFRPQPTPRYHNEQPFEVPEDLKDKEPIFRGHKYEHWLSVCLVIVSSLVTYFWRVGENYTLPVFGVSLGLAIFMFVKSKGITKKTALTTPILILVALFSLIGSYFLSYQFPEKFIDYVFILTFTPLVSLLVSSTFWRVWEDNRILAADKLRKSNSFGSSSGSALDAMVEERLNQVWGLTGARVFRVDHPAFSHMIFFDDRVAVVKGLYVDAPVSLAVVGSNILARTESGIYVDLANNYLGSLKFFEKFVDKKVEVKPIVAVFPGANMLNDDYSSEFSFVKDYELARSILEFLTKDKKFNVIDQKKILSTLTAAYQR